MHWSVCILSISVCEDPNDIANGTVTADGVEAQFRCNIGFSLSGNSAIICNSDGTGWSGQAPNCGKQKFPLSLFILIIKFYGTERLKIPLKQSFS